MSGVHMWAAVSTDGYLYGATTNEGGWSERYWLLSVADAPPGGWNIIELHGVPPQTAEWLEAEGTSAQHYGDGYEAMAAAAPYTDPPGCIPCPGRAHRDANIDNCGLCAPHWGYVKV